MVDPSVLLFKVLLVTNLTKVLQSVRKFLTADLEQPCLTSKAIGSTVTSRHYVLSSCGFLFSSDFLLISLLFVASGYYYKEAES